MTQFPPHLDILGLVFFSALFLSLFIVPITTTLARKLGAVDVPKNRSSHVQPTTRLGGLGIAASLLVSCLMFLPLNAFAWAFLAGLFVIIITGFVDDVADIGPRWKFVGQLMAAGAFVLLGGGSLEHLGDFLGRGEINLNLLAIPVTIFCMVGGMNAFNLSDGLDGLAGGLAAIALVFFAYFSWHAGAENLLLISMALLGAVMGFLRYNTYPAKLFMGDCGSLTLGYVLAALLVSGSQREGGNHIPLVAWVMVVTLPLQDTLLVMARRIYYGHSPFLPDRTHLHHRLMKLGLAHPAVVAVIYVAMALYGVLALVLQGHSEWYTFAALIIVGTLLFGCVAGLQHAGFVFNAGRRKRPYSTIRQWPIFRGVSRWVRARVVHISILLLLMLCIPALFFPVPVLNRNEALALLMLAWAVLFYGFHRFQGYRGMLHGAIYASIFTLFFIYNLAAEGGRHWPSLYLTSISILAALWVTVKIIFRRKMVILNTSSFELLMLFLSWFMPFVLFKELNLPVNVIDAGRHACLQVLPFMLSIKIYLDREPRTNKWVVGILSGTTVLIALRGLMG